MNVCRLSLLIAILPVALLTAVDSVDADDGTPITVTVADAETGAVLPCRLYVQNTQSGEWHFASSASPDGTAVEYNKQIGTTPSVEMHTTLSAHSIRLQLAPGTYRVRAEHGKEFVPAEQELAVGARPVKLELTPKRFINMQAAGWYCGDTHVHRAMADLPNLVLAEDLNVALPLNYWVRDTTEIPSATGPSLEAKPIAVDATHVIYPINTEYEIFSVNRQRHTLGAVFVLNHKSPLNIPAPPVLAVAEEARRQGAILDLDKHSWAWSMMIVPVMKVDLFELSNNHNWRTQFGFPQWTIENAPDWPEVERDATGFTELGWTEFGMQTYYALLNCGFRMRVTGGTGAGVHPVPLGHGRVYVHTGPEFSYDRWIEHLNAGHSFVTTGPLMDLRFNGQMSGATWIKQTAEYPVSVTGAITSLNRLKCIEIIRNGVSEQVVEVAPERTPEGALKYTLNATVRLAGSGWIAVRCFEDLPDAKVSFAHTNPVFVDEPGVPLTARRRDAEFFVRRMDEEIARNTGVLTDESLAEYRRAREIYQAILDQAAD